MNLLILFWLILSLEIVLIKDDIKSLFKDTYTSNQTIFVSAFDEIDRAVQVIGGHIYFEQIVGCFQHKLKYSHYLPPFW
mgnify:FL=1